MTLALSKTKLRLCATSAKSSDKVPIIIIFFKKVAGVCRVLQVTKLSCFYHHTGVGVGGWKVGQSKNKTQQRKAPFRVMAETWDKHISHIPPPPPPPRSQSKPYWTVAGGELDRADTHIVRERGSLLRIN